VTTTTGKTGCGRPEDDNNHSSTLIHARMTVAIVDGHRSENGNGQTLDTTRSGDFPSVGFHRRHRTVHWFWFSELHEGKTTEVPKQRQTVFQTEDPETGSTDATTEDQPPTQLNSTVLTACAQVDTCLPGAACIPFLHTLELHALPLPGLRIKTYISHSFWNNNKLLFPRTQAPKLSPSSNLSTPFSLTHSVEA
jgi:hypothetical protein